MTRLRLFLEDLRSRLWFRPTLYSITALGWVALSYLSEGLLPHDWWVDISRETLIDLLSILASTMLTVATFSVSAVASAYNAVANSATPRATRIVMDDSRVQLTLAAFIYAFMPIARDGAGMVEVGLRLQKALRVLEGMGHGDLRTAAENFRGTALELSDKALPTASQRRMVRAAAGV